MISNLSCGLDHLVVGAGTLEQGVDYIKNALGVDMPFGGSHPKMGTHNHLMRIGNKIFLEIIAVDLAAEPPDRPRWFGLDDPLVKKQICAQPVLLTWVVNTVDIHSLLKQTVFSMGRPEQLRRGDLRWYFGLPHDGRLLAGGILPYVIQWQTDAHPAEAMADMNCRLLDLEIHHPYPDWLESALVSIGVAGAVNINGLSRNENPYLVAHFDTPYGRRELRSNKDLAGA